MSKEEIKEKIMSVKPLTLEKIQGKAHIEYKSRTAVNAYVGGAVWANRHNRVEIAKLQAEKAELVSALRESCLQIEYLHGKFTPTGSGETVLSRSAMILAKYEQ